MRYWVRCKLVPGVLKDEFVAVYPPDKPKASAIAFREEILDLTEHPPKKGAPAFTDGFVPVKMKNGFATFLDERGLKFTPRLKDIRRQSE